MLQETIAGGNILVPHVIKGETILDADLTARAGMAELIAEAFGAGIGIGIVSSGSHAWVEPLVRQLVGDGVVGVVVTADDAPADDRYRAALAELGASASDSLAFAGSPANQRAATLAGLASVLVGGEGAVSAPLRVVDCQRVHDTWQESHRPSAA